MLNKETVWVPDRVLPGFEAFKMIQSDDYEGEVITTLIRRNAPQPSDKAVLYIHGYTDYFFQTHIADAFNERGFNFYALDLRRYGRSLLPHQRPNFCKSLNEYFPEITDALDLITETYHNESVLLMGHSTGGLIASLYAHEGRSRDKIDGLILNSPFFDWFLPRNTLLAVKALAVAAILFPYYGSMGDGPGCYMESIYAHRQGEWEMNEKWRPLEGFPIYAGWCRAISRGHAQVRQGLDIQCPVLMMSSDKSLMQGRWSPECQTADTVLNIHHMKNSIPNLGEQITYKQIADGMHDLFLSRQDVRRKAFHTVFRWIESLPVTKTKSAGKETV